MQEIGRSIIRLESVDSTNNYTANCARQNKLRHGAVIMAVEQTAGKGQMGAQWQSDAGSNLTFSVFLNNVNLSVGRQFLLTKIVSLSLVDLLGGFGITASVKWPNDIYVGDRKIAGVLIENVLQGKEVTRSILGIGLNVNQQHFDSIPATSLFLEKGMPFSIDDVLFSFIAAFNKRLKQWPSEILDLDYLKILRWLNESRNFEDHNGAFVGAITGVTDSGHLIIEREEVIEQSREEFIESNGEKVIDPDREEVIEPNGEKVIEPNGEKVIDPDRDEVIEPSRDAPTKIKKRYNLKEIRFIS